MAATAALMALAFAAPTLAEIKLSASLDSDYRYRGTSRSGSRPALTLGAGYDAPSGFYVGALALSADTTHFGVRSVGDVEYAGYAWRDGVGRSWDLGVNNHDVEAYGLTHRAFHYNDVYVGLAKDDLSGHVYYSPNYFAKGARTAYFDLNGAIRSGEAWRLLGHLGLLAPLGDAAGAPPRRARVDVRAGVAHVFQNSEVRLTWTGTTPRPRPENPQSRSGLVLGASLFF